MVRLPEAFGARNGTSGTGPQLRLLVVGDSSAAGVGVETQQQALLGCLLDHLSPHCTIDYTLVAQTGARTRDAIGWLAQMPEGNYDVIVTALGVNDVTRLTSPQGFAAQQRVLLKRLTDIFNGKLIVVSDIPPIGQFPALPKPLRWVMGRHGDRLRTAMHLAVARHKNAIMLPFEFDLRPEQMASDGFHPGPDVYEAWAAAIAKAIKSHLPQLDADAAAP